MVVVVVGHGARIDKSGVEQRLGGAETVVDGGRDAVLVVVVMVVVVEEEVVVLALVALAMSIGSGDWIDWVRGGVGQIRTLLRRRSQSRQVWWHACAEDDMQAKTHRATQAQLRCRNHAGTTKNLSGRV